MPRHTRRSFLRVSGGLLGGIAVGTTVTVASSSDRFLVDARDRLDRSDAEAAGLDVVHDLGAIDLLVVRGDESDVQSLDADYAPDTRYSLDLPVEDRTPVAADEDATDEPLYPLQWDKQAQDIPEAHEQTRGEDTRVTIIDTGVAAGHPDLRNVNTNLSRNFTDDDYGAGGPYGGYHGTHVAGIVAADDRNDAGVVGSAPGTEVVDCRVFSPGALASFADVLAAIVYSAEIGADAANMSIGAYPIPRQGLGSFYGRTLNRVTTYANSNGTLLVASAGNAGADLQHDGDVISLPNEAANTMSISATGPIGFGWGDPGTEDPPESPAFYTNYGTNAINLGAPGGDADLDAIGTGVDWHLDLVLSTVAVPEFDEDDNYLGAAYSWGWAAGTSMAAPQVTGAAALVAARNPHYNANQVRSTLERTADTVEEYDKTYYGSGFLDPVAALE